MKELEQIQSKNREAAERVRETGVKPHKISERAIVRLKQGMLSELIEIPFIGDASFDNFIEEEEFFVDSSGLGTSGEMALSINQFIEQLTIDHYYAITSTGQFQIYIQEYSLKEEKE